jgi:hypothetical protein
MRILVLLTALLLPAIALAEDAAERAATLAESANKLARSGEYTDALALFEKAYALSPEPVLLYNIGRVAEKLQDWKKAAGALRAFLEVEKDAAKRAKAQDVLNNVQAHLPAYLTVSCPVAGALVEVDGKPAGRVPLQAPLEVTPGKHVVKVLAPAKKPFEKAVEVKGTESIEIAARLDDEPAVVALVVEPVAARVVVDGKAVGPGARQTMELAPGAHTLRAEGDGYEAGEQRFEVVAGERKSVSLALVKKKVEVPPAVPATVLAKPAPTEPAKATADLPSTTVRAKEEPGSPWYKKWWVWTAAGAVVVGGVTAAVLLTRGSGGASYDDNWSLRAPLEVGR